MKSRHHLVILDVSDAVLVRELKRIIEQVIANIEVKQKKDVKMKQKKDVTSLPPPSPPHDSSQQRVTLIYDRQKSPPPTLMDEWRTHGITHLIILSGNEMKAPNSVESPHGMTLHLMKKPIKIQALLELLEGDAK